MLIMRKKIGVYNGVSGVCNQRDSFSVQCKNTEDATAQRMGRCVFRIFALLQEKRGASHHCDAPPVFSSIKIRMMD